MTLLLREVQNAAPVPLCVPCPADGPLGARCRRFLAKPTLHESIDDWCADLGTSRRAFTRRFRRETGLSFAAWQRQACLVTAIPRLAANESVTAVAFDLGYASVAAFSVLFRRVLGTPPSRYQG